MWHNIKKKKGRIGVVKGLILIDMAEKSQQILFHGFNF